MKYGIRANVSGGITGDRSAWCSTDGAPHGTGSSLDPSSPRTLFEGRFEKNNLGSRAANYDIALDGQRFVMVRRKNPVTPTVIHVVLNWPEALR